MDAIIELVTGALGGGKTYFAVQRMLAHWARGGTVFTNVDIVWARCREYVEKRWGVVVEDEQFRKLEADQVRQFWDHVARGTTDCPVMVVLDEVHLYFNAHDWADLDRKLLEIATQARKMKIHFLFLMQSDTDFAKQIRGKAQYVWAMRDLQKIKVPFLGIGFPFPLMSQACVDAKNRKIIIEHRWVRKDRAIWPCYDTHQQLVDFGLDVVGKKQLQKTKKKGYTVRTVLVLGALVGLLCWTGFRIYGYTSAPDGPPASARIPGTVVQVDIRRKPQAQPVVCGLLVIEKRVFVTVLDGDRTRTVEVQPSDRRIDGVVVDGQLLAWK